MKIATNIKGEKFGSKTIPGLGLYLIKYDKNKCDMTDLDIRKCRSLVLEIGTNNLVSVSPFKSDSLDYLLDVYNNNPGDIVYEEFVDGTMINLFKYKDVYYIYKELFGCTL